MSIVRPKGKCLSRKELENYVNNKLPKQQVLRIEHHLLECELCSTSVEGMAYLKSGNLDAALQDQNYPKQYYLIVIIGILLLAIGFLYFNPFSPKQSLRVEKEIIVFEDQLNISIPRGDDNQMTIEAYQYFRKKDYKKTLSLLQKTDNNEDVNLLLLSVYSHLKLNNFAKAKEQAQQLNQRFPMFWQEANMIHAFIHIQEREKDKAGEKLKKIIKEGVDSPIQQQAEKILKLLY